MGSRIILDYSIGLNTVVLYSVVLYSVAKCCYYDTLYKRSVIVECCIFDTVGMYSVVEMRQSVVFLTLFIWTVWYGYNGV